MMKLGQPSFFVNFSGNLLKMWYNNTKHVQKVRIYEDTFYQS